MTLLCYVVSWVLATQSPFSGIASQPPVLDVNAADFPASCMADFSRKPASAGKCGRVFCGSDGRLYFEDGTRASFWGVNIAKDSVFQPEHVIDRAVAAIACAGFNLVRFHHFDDVTGLLPRERADLAERIDPRKLACLDYWIYRLGEKGIYVYLDLLDYRTFWAEEGVVEGSELGRGAKPYAVFDPRLIELQAAYARQLLCEHVNPYTGRTYAEDRAVLFVELCDENGLFRAAKRGLSLKPPYDRNLQLRFAAWLKARYGGDGRLREAWTDSAGRCCLMPGESLENATVKLGSLTEGTGRDTDTALFFADVHRQYFAAMRKALREGGLNRALIGGVTDPTIPADLRACAESLDFVGVNWYWDHPVFPAGRPWETPYAFHNRSPMEAEDLEDFPVVAAAARVWRKPLVVREWCPCWPNKYRGAAFLEAAAYGALQDVDALILFHLSVNPQRRAVGLFDVTHDPVRWGLAAVAGKIFEARLVPPAPYSVLVGYSSADVLLAPLTPMASPLHKLGYVCRVANVFFDEKFAGDGHFVVSSGRSAAGRYPQRRVLLFSNAPWADPYRRVTGSSLDERNGCEVATVPRITGLFGFGGTLFDAGQRVELTADPAYFLPDVLNNPDLRPIGRCPEAQAAFGVRNVASERYCFKKLPEDLSARAALDALGQVVRDETISHRILDEGVLASAGGHVRIDRTRNLLLVEAPQVLVVAGDVASKPVKVGPLQLSTKTQHGALVWLSLDGQSASDSKQWLLKMVSIAVNTGEEKQEAGRTKQGEVYRLLASGSPPVLTLGHAGGETRVVLNGRPVLSIDLVNGTWELARDRRELYFWCDTAGTAFQIPLAAANAQVVVVGKDGGQFAGRISQPLQYPPEALLVRIAPVGETSQ